MFVTKTMSTSEFTKLVPSVIPHFNPIQLAASDSNGAEQSDELEHVAILSTN